MYRPVIGSDSLHDVSNENGTRLLNFVHSKNFTIISMYFPRKIMHKLIWKSPDGDIIELITYLLTEKIVGA